MKASAIAAVFSAVIMMAACTQAETGSIVLQGNVQGNPEEVIVVSFLPGQPIDYHYPAVNDGRFEFSMDGVEGFADLIVSVGGVEFGARVNALDTLRMNFVVNKYAKDVEVIYDGTTEKESRIWKDFYETYHRWSSYNLPKTNPEMTYDDCIALLDENDAKFKADHKADMNRYYTHRAELSHALLKAILLDVKAGEEGVSSYDYPEYKELMNMVDPNDPDEVTFPLVNRWAYFHMAEFGDDPVDCATEFMKKYGKKITNPAVKSMLEKNISSYCQIEAPKDSQTGIPVPDTTMETTGGSEEQPFWPQFRLAGTDQDDFCNKVGINTIPRFLLIGPDGKFIDGDCARPSDENIEDILNKAIAGQ